MQLHDKSSAIPKSECDMICRNLRAFEANFGEVILYRNRAGAYKVYLDYADMVEDRYVQMCRNVDYLDGWLYGVVQGGIVRAKQNERGV